MDEFNDQYRQLVQSAPAGIFHACDKGLYTYCNDAWQEIFQLSMHEAQGNGWSKHLYPADKNQLTIQWTDTVKRQRRFSAQFKLLLPNGKIRHIHCQANPIKDENNNVTGYVGVVQDISQKKITEQHLIDSEGRARAIIEQSPIPYAVRATNDDVVYLNPAFINTFGYSKEEISKVSDWYEKAYPNKRYREKTLSKWNKKIEELEKDHSCIATLEVNIVCKNKQVKTVLMSPIALHDSQGNRYAVSLYDITKLKEIERSLKDSEERFTLAVNGSSVGIWDWDLRNNKVFYASELKHEMGYTDKDFNNDGEAFYGHMHPDDIAGVKNAVALHFSSDLIPYRVQYRMRHKNGDYHWYQAVGKALKDKKGRAYRMAGSHTNISAQMHTQERLNLANMVFEQSSEAIIVTDQKGFIEAVNPAFCLLTGFKQEAVIGKHYRFLNSRKNEKKLVSSIRQSLTSIGCWSGEIWSKRKDSDDFAESIVINAVKDDNDNTIRFIALFTDITDQKQTQELIWKQAHYDNLTQLLNRHSFTQYLHQAVKSDQAFALLFIDLDHFKQINDTLGHKTGDELLIKAAARIKHCVRNSDIVARFGGDEFTVILSGIKNITSIKRICHDIIVSLAEPFLLNDENAYISASIGITQFPLDSHIVEDLYKYADQAMYDAKRSGRNRYAFFTQKLQEDANKQRKISADLRIALEQNQFKVLYQPIINLSDKKIYKAEALIRWYHPEKGIISPADFIPIAEETGLILEIGDWVFRQAAMQTKIWRKYYDKDFQISINKSPIQFYNGSSQEHWSQFLKTINLPGDGITVEITEGLLLDGVTVVKDKLNSFHESGMKISLDDFGTGYSALSYLKKFAIDFIKIDQSFVKNIEHDAYDLVLCETIISMAHKLNKKVIAEGIETEKQREFLHDCGCDYGQGYLFSRPITAEELTKLLTKSDT